MKKYAIFVLLIFAFFLRIYSINSPLIGVHQWRQTDTASVSRNFYENGFRFSYPQIDWGGNSSGFVEADFPAYTFTVALLYKIFGVHESLGRLLSVFASLITIFFLYLLVKKHIDEKTALWSAFFYTVLPLNIFYSRSFQPETTLLMASVVGIYFFSEWMTSEKWKFCFLSAVFISLACLMKPQTLYLGLPLLYLGWVKYKKQIFLRWQLWLYVLLVLTPVVLWYYHTHQVGIRSGLTLGIWGYGSDKWGNWDLVFTLDYWSRIIVRMLKRHFAWMGFPIFLIGLFLKRRYPTERLFDFWVTAIFIYFIIVGRGNYQHEYYQLPLMLPAAVFMGKVFARYFNINEFKEKKTAALAVCLAGIMVFSLGRLHLMLKEENVGSSVTLQLSEAVRQKVEKNVLIIFISNGDPSVLYYSHHKGWTAIPDAVTDPFLDDMSKKGARYLVGHYKDFMGKPERHARIKELLSSKKFEVVFNDGSSFIIKLPYG